MEPRVVRAGGEWMKNFALHVKYRWGGVGLITLGCSPHDCLSRLPLAIDHWEMLNVREIDEAWISIWQGSPAKGKWVILEWMDVKKSRFVNAIRANRRHQSSCNFVMI